MDQAELILHVLDASQPLTSEDQRLLEELAGRPALVVKNKADLPEELKLEARPGQRAVSVSCVTGAGLESLKDAIRDAVWAGEVRADMVQAMINSRHQDALRRAAEAIRRTLEGLAAELTLELVAMDLRIAVNAVGEIVGKTTTEDLLDSIFSQFCIGK